MATYPCETCPLRAKHDKNPKSLAGRFWRWHINFCPGWKAYFTHQDEETKADLREKYSFAIELPSVRCQGKVSGT